ncbi:MAG TPA: hypothetical protein VHO46_10210 [Bacteroidales bacterium]|nr:hypothetical protein [Bacteroidales bacterium]
MKYLYFAFIVFFLASGQLGAQDENRDQAEKELSLSIKSMNFIRNDEYFNPLGSPGFHLSGEIPLWIDKSLWIEGYTLTGFFFRPEVVYNPTEKLSLRAGAHFLKYWGAGGFTQIKPVLSTSIQIAPGTILTIGSLSGSDKHRMFDPHFNFERLYTDYSENGFQIRTERKHIFNDAWINWENFIFTGDTEREIFTFGESFRYVSHETASPFNIEIPVQIQFKHFGGQVSNYPEHVTTFFNLASGLRVNFNTGDMTGKIGVEYTGFLNSVIPERETYIISHGHASWWRLHYDIKRFYFGSSYWVANNFYAPNGNGIFASVYRFDSKYVIRKREIITGSAYLKLLPEDYLELFFGIDTYYDMCEKRLDYAATLHLNFEDIFRLLIIK